MSNRPIILPAVLSLLSILYGCGIGYNRMLFTTKTNVGFEIDSKPPSLQLSIGRLEGVFAPQFERGKKLPVMASFKFQTNKAFSPSVGSAFATGDAATVLASLYSDPTPFENWQDRLQVISENGLNGQKVDSSLTLNEEPKIKSWFSTLFEPGKFQKSDVRPVLFGTDTSFGLKVAWSGLSSSIPDTARLGYARKELAWVPITMQEESGTAGQKRYKVKTSSLLATLDSGMEQPRIEEGQPSAPLKYVQYFASGDAATLLSMQQTVRQAMLTRLDPNAKKLAGEWGAGLAGEAKIQAMVYLSFVYGGLRERAKKDGVKEAEVLAKALDAMGQHPPQSYTRYTWFPKAEPKPLLEHKTITLPPRDQRKFSHAMQYWGDTIESIKALQAIAEQIKADPKFTFQELPDKTKQPTDVIPERVTQLMIESKDTAEAFAKYDQQLRRDPAVIDAAMYFMDTMLTKK